MTEHTDVTETPAESATGSRRALLGKGAIAAVAGAAAAVALSEPTSAGNANGQSLDIGEVNTGTSSTRLRGGSTFRVDTGTTDSDASIVGVVGGSDLSGKWGVKGENAGSTAAANGAGVYGTARTDGAAGVYAENTSANGVGLSAAHTIQATGSGIGMQASSTNGVGVASSGPKADVRLEGSSIIQFFGEGVGGTGRGTAGELAGNGTGELWFCYETGIGKWVRLAAPSSAGSFNPVSPYRAYDSRRPAPTPGALGPNSSRVVSLAASRDSGTGAVIAADAIPAGAIAVTFNLTVVNTVGSGFLAVAEGDAASTNASSINWSSSGAILANAATIKLDSSRQVKVFNGSGGTTDFIIDITGYYR